MGRRAADVPRSAVDGIPNLFSLGANQTGVTPNYTFMATEQSRHIAYVMSTVLGHGHGVVEPAPDAEREWVAEIHRLAEGGAPYAESCTPSSLNGEGRPLERTGFIANPYNAGPIAFTEVLEAWRDEGQLRGLLLREGHTSDPVAPTVGPDEVLRFATTRHG